MQPENRAVLPHAEQKYTSYLCLLHAPREIICNKEIATSPLPARKAFLYFLFCIVLKVKLNIHRVIIVYPMIIMDNSRRFGASC